MQRRHTTCYTTQLFDRKGNNPAGSFILLLRSLMRRPSVTASILDPNSTRNAWIFFLVQYPWNSADSRYIGNFPIGVNGREGSGYLTLQWGELEVKIKELPVTNRIMMGILFS